MSRGAPHATLHRCRQLAGVQLPCHGSGNWYGSERDSSAPARRGSSATNHKAVGLGQLHHSCVLRQHEPSTCIQCPWRCTVHPQPCTVRPRAVHMRTRIWCPIRIVPMVVHCAVTCRLAWPGRAHACRVPTDKAAAANAKCHKHLHHIGYMPSCISLQFISKTNLSACNCRTLARNPHIRWRAGITTSWLEAASWLALIVCPTYNHLLVNAHIVSAAIEA